MLKISPLIIRHRINSVEELSNISPDQGVEIDLRDRGDRLVLAHDPFTDGEDFTTYLQHFRHNFLVLNIKSERIEHRVIQAMREVGTVTRYFFLDSSFPMIYSLINLGERNIALRFSEFESLESLLLLAGKVEWIWMDCFTKMPLTPAIYSAIKEAGFKICAVSPELQGHGLDFIVEYISGINFYSIDAICTKYPCGWENTL